MTKHSITKHPSSLRSCMMLLNLAVRTEKDSEALSDLGEMVEQEINSLQLATLDELTKISNRRGFLSLAPHYLNFCKRQRTISSLVFIDLDKFKYINDTYGHAEGDRALTAFTEQMTLCFRQTDLLARLGGMSL